MNSPERIWCHPTERQPVAAKNRNHAKWIRGSWKNHDSGAHGDVEYIRADLAAVPAQVQVKPLVGWVIGNGQGNRWRCVWKWETNSEWTDDMSKAIKFATRDDAEAFSADDEDAWLIQEVQIPAIEPQPDPRDEVIARLVEENNLQIKARAQHWLRRTISAPEDAAVEKICEKYGYGAVMDAASRLWARKPYGSGAFYVGGCIGFKSDDEARAALAEAKAVQK